MDIQKKGSKCGSEVNIASFCSLAPSVFRSRDTRWHKLLKKNLGCQIRSTSIELRFSSIWKDELLALIELEQMCCKSISWSLNDTENTSALILSADKEAISAIAAEFNLTKSTVDTRLGEKL